MSHLEPVSLLLDANVGDGGRSSGVGGGVGSSGGHCHCVGDGGRRCPCCPPQALVGLCGLVAVAIIVIYRKVSR